MSKTAQQQEKKSKAKAGIAIEHLDIIKNEFWQQRSWILSGRAGRLKLGDVESSSSLEVRPGPMTESLVVSDRNGVEYGQGLE